MAILNHLPPLSAPKLDFLLGGWVHEWPHEIDEGSDSPWHVLKDGGREGLGIVVCEDVEGFSSDLGERGGRPGEGGGGGVGAGAVERDGEGEEERRWDQRGEGVEVWVLTEMLVGGP